MPNKDETGPNGQGPMTGRGMGNCNNVGGQMRGSDESRGGFLDRFGGFFGRGCRRGQGRGMGFGKGRGRGQGGFGQGGGRGMGRGRN